MKNEIVLDLNILKDGTLNKYINLERRNRFAAGKIKKQLTEYVMWETVAAMKRGVVFNWPFDIDMRFYVSNMRTDPDNWMFVQKYVFDGFQKAEWKGKKFLENDNLKTLMIGEHNPILRYFYTFEIDKEKPRLLIRPRY